MKLSYNLLTVLIALNLVLIRGQDDQEPDVDGNQNEDGPGENPEYQNEDPNQDYNDQQMNYFEPQPPPPPPPPGPQAAYDEILCNCGEVAKKCMVKKEGPNKGREMLVCPRQLNDLQKCNFFLWADQAPPGPDGNGGQNFQRSNRGYGGGGGGGNYQRRGNFRNRNQNYGGGGGGGGGWGRGGGGNWPTAYSRSFSRPRQNYGRPPPQPQQGPDEEILCECGAPAKKFVARRDMPNKGREFYCCPKMREDPERCNFFLWAN